MGRASRSANARGHAKTDRQRGPGPVRLAIGAGSEVSSSVQVRRRANGVLAVTAKMSTRCLFWDAGPWQAAANDVQNGRCFDAGQPLRWCCSRTLELDGGDGAWAS